MGWDIWRYIVELSDHWAAFMTGGIPVAIWVAWERLRNKPISYWAFVAFLVFGFIAASFQTWRDERTQGATTRNPAIVLQLQKYYVEAEEHRRTIEQATGAQRDIDRREAEQWANEAGHWIIENMGMAAYVRLIKLPEERSKYGVESGHQTEAMLALIRDNLEKLIESGAWDKR